MYILETLAFALFLCDAPWDIIWEGLSCQLVDNVMPVTNGSGPLAESVKVLTRDSECAVHPGSNTSGLLVPGSYRTIKNCIPRHGSSKG